MTPEEIDRLLAEMTVAWPNHTLLTPEARLWRGRLTPCEPVPAFEAISALVDTSEFWPHWSTFRAEYQLALRRQRLDAKQLPEAEPEKHVKEARRLKAKQQIAKMRETLASTKGGG